MLLCLFFSLFLGSDYCIHLCLLKYQLIPKCEPGRLFWTFWCQMCRSLSSTHFATMSKIIVTANLLTLCLRSKNTVKRHPLPTLSRPNQLNTSLLLCNLLHNLSVIPSLIPSLLRPPLRPRHLFLHITS